MTTAARRRWTNRLAKLAQRLSQFPSPRARPWLLAGAAVVFVAGGVLAAVQLDLAGRDIRWVPLVLAAVIGVPATILGNSVEYAVSGRLLGKLITLRSAVPVAVVAAAANLMPVPGAVAVRIQALHRLGLGYHSATASTAAMGLCWIGLSAAAAAALVAADAAPAAVAGLGTLAVATLAASAALLFGQVDTRGQRARLGAQVATTEAAFVVIMALRLYLVLAGLGFQPTVDQAVMLALAPVIASATGIFPGGLGLRELLGALFAPVVGLAVASGFLAVAVNSALSMVVHAPVALAIVAAQRRSQPGQVSPTPGEHVG